MSLRFCVCAMFACALVATSAFGAPITYIIDPTQSVLTLSGTYAGIALQTNSFYPDGTTLVSGFTATYSGTITADRNLLVNTLQITGGAITAQNNNAINALPPSPPAPANYFLWAAPAGASLPGGVAPSFYGAIRNFSFLPSSQIINSATSFDASQISAAISSGQLDYTYSYYSDGTYFSIPFSGDLDFASESASLVDANDMETLTIPVSTDLLVQAGGEPIILDLSGNIVATATVPEPGCLIVGTALLCGHRRRT